MVFYEIRRPTEMRVNPAGFAKAASFGWRLTPTPTPGRWQQVRVSEQQQRAENHPPSQLRYSTAWTTTAANEIRKLAMVAEVEVHRIGAR